MKQGEIDWRSGQVVYWDMDSIDTEKPVKEQLSELKEDLAQIRFSGRLLIDVGWYPEFSDQGAFSVKVIAAMNWDEPLMEEECSSVQSLRLAFVKAIAFAEKFAAKKL